jgi:hypothetical protein
MPGGSIGPVPSGPYPVFAITGIITVAINSTTVMNSLPVPAIIAALAAVIALPFSAAAAGTFFLTASLGFIIHADYAQRMKRVRLPRLSVQPRPSKTRTPFVRENHPLAA